VFLKNDWYMAGWSTEVTDRPLGRMIAGEAIVLFRDAAGRISALRDQCCHRGVALSPGKVVEKGIQCPYHGLVFNGAGVCVHIPSQDNIPAKARVRSFAVEERDAIIWLWLGESEAADPAKIVAYPYHGDPLWPYKVGYVHANCGYEMLIDNIMDLTHVGYVHSKTIGGGDLADHATATMKTERTERGVKFARWLHDSVPPPTYAKAVDYPGRIDRWQEEELIVPGAIIQFSGGVDVSQRAFDGGSREGGFAMRVFHGIVPETENSCHYFFSVSNGFRQNEPAVTELIFNQVAVTLDEDVVICESQQARTLQYPDTRFVDLRSDEARVIYRRHLASRLAAEREQSAGAGSSLASLAG
jgi:vanillate O-demethylase monooxygenase subunit